MINLLTGIQTRFNADPELTAIFPQGVYLSAAPDAAPWPRAVVSLVSAVVDRDSFTTTCRSFIRRNRVQFSVFTNTTDTDALEAADLIADRFDFATLDLGDDQCILVEPTNEGVLREDQTTWHAFVEYLVTVGENTAPSLRHTPQRIVNGTFDNGLTGWDVSGGFNAVVAEGGKATLNGQAVLSQGVSLTPGKHYTLSFTVSDLSQGNLFAGWFLQNELAGNIVSGEFTHAGTTTTPFVAPTSGTATLSFNLIGNAPGYSVANVSVT